MPRPTTKEQLLVQSQRTMDELMAVVESLSTVQLEMAGTCGEWSVKDILSHLHAWHELFFTWYRVGMAGGKPAIPAPGFSFKDTPALNEKLYRENQDLDCTEVMASLAQSHRQVIALVANHTEDELFTRQYYPWTGTTTLGAYFIGSMSSHYEWAGGLTKKWRRELARSGDGGR